MAQRSSQDTPKTVLDLALELGVRTDTVIQAMQRLGLETIQPTEQLDAGLEQSLVNRLVEDGLVSSSLQKGKGRRKRTEEPLVNDDIVTEALGASEGGFNESKIPRQITFESSFAEKPSLFQRFFGKKQNLVGSLKEQNLSADEINNLFTLPVSRQTGSDYSPFQDRERTEQEPPTQSEQIAVDDAPQDTLDEVEFDEELLDMEDVDLEGEEIEDVDTDELDDIEGLEDLSEITEGEESSEDQEEVEGLDEEIDAWADEEEEEEGTEEDDTSDLEGEEEGEGEEEEEEAPIPTFLEKMFSRIQLSPAETWTLMGGMLAIMLIVIGVTFYWWRNLSPEYQDNLYQEALNHQKHAINHMEEWKEARFRKSEADKLTMEKEWKKGVDQYQNAATDFKELVENFPRHKNHPDAFARLCDSNFQLAQAHRTKAANAKDKQTKNSLINDSETYYRKMIEGYEAYLDYLVDRAQKSVGDSSADVYPDITKQQEAIYRIALGHRFLGGFQKATEQFEQFANKYPDADEADDALLGAAASYQSWAEANKEMEPELLDESLKTYQKTLNPKYISKEEPRKRMNVLAEMGDVEKRLYDRSLANEDAFSADEHLAEAVDYYEQAKQEAQYSLNYAQQSSNAMAGEEETDPERDEDAIRRERAEILKKLADLYLVQGKEMANKWAEYERSAEKYPKRNPNNSIGTPTGQDDSNVRNESLRLFAYKQAIDESAQEAKQDTQDFIGKAQELYQTLLSESEALADPEQNSRPLQILSDKQLKDIHYNNAESNFILRNYKDTLDSGEKILSTFSDMDPDYQAKVYYLLGHAAWKLADDSKNYNKVREYYSKALDLNPLYPADENGEISHLAEIRLANSYFMVYRNYPRAIEQFNNMIKNYPDSGFSYLTRYWYAKTLDDYGEVLNRQDNSAPAKKVKASTETHGEEVPLTAEEAHRRAVDQYSNAINTRDDAKYIDTEHETYLIEIMFNRGHSAFKAGMFKRAEAYMNEALNKYRNNEIAQKYIPLAMERLGDINIHLANYGKAIRHYKDYLSNSFNDTDARVSQKLAGAYLNQYSYDKAREWFRRIIREYPPPSEKAAARALRQGRTLEKGPGFDAMKKLAESYLREAGSYMGDERKALLQKALESYQDIVKSYPLDAQHKGIPSDPESQRMIGMINYQMGNYDDAVQNYRQYLNSVPDDPRKGMILFKIGKALFELHQENMGAPNPNQNRSYINEAIQTLGNIEMDMMENPIQYADAMILLGQAYEEKAAQFHPETQQGDPNLWEQALENAIDAYTRVENSVKVQNKVDEARRMKATVRQTIRERQEVDIASSS